MTNRSFSMLFHILLIMAAIAGTNLIIVSALYGRALSAPAPVTKIEATAALPMPEPARYVESAARLESPAGAIYAAPTQSDWLKVCVPKLPVYTYPSHDGTPALYLEEGNEVRIHEVHRGWAYIGDVMWVDMAGLCGK